MYIHCSAAEKRMPESTFESDAAIKESCIGSCSVIMSSLQPGTAKDMMDLQEWNDRHPPLVWYILELPVNIGLLCQQWYAVVTQNEAIEEMFDP